MTTDPEPQYATLSLPEDTVDLTAQRAIFILTASGDGHLVPHLALGTHEMGWYRVLIPRSVFVSMIGQLDYFKNLSPDQLGGITDTLHGNTDDVGDNE